MKHLGYYYRKQKQRMNAHQQTCRERIYVEMSNAVFSVLKVNQEIVFSGNQFNYNLGFLRVCLRQFQFHEIVPLY